MKKAALTLTALAAALLLQACSKPTEPVASVASAPVAKAPMPTAVAWIKPEGANMDALFAQAKASNKPLFLYWGAVWCPPCNQVKATVFNRPDFIERSQQFIPVYLANNPAKTKIGAGLACGALWTVSKGILKGDIVLCPDGSGS